MKYANTDERFGYAGPFEAESKEILADEMMPTLQVWADEANRDVADLREEFINALKELDETNERVIFDNGGGVTLQLKGWACYYQNAANAARDVAAWIEAHDTSDWEGHENEALAVDPTNEEIRNGGYRVVEIADLPGALTDPTCEGWGNVEDFREAFVSLK